MIYLSITTTSLVSRYPLQEQLPRKGSQGFLMQELPSP